MEYTISKAKRNGIIFCSSFLILYVLVTGLIFLINPPTKLNLTEMLIRNVIFLIAFGYLMLVFYKYFMHYQLKVLQYTVLVLFILEIISKSMLFTHLFESDLKMTLFLSKTLIWIIATIVLIVGTFRNRTKADTGINSIRDFAITRLLVFVFATNLPFLVDYINSFRVQQYIELTAAIPFMFAIVFALRIKLKE